MVKLLQFGRMKGNISCNDNIYKMSSKALSNIAKQSYSQENKKIALNCKVTIQKNKPISIDVTSANSIDLYKNLKIQYEINELPQDAKNKPLQKQTVIEHIAKTSSTPYQFKNINVVLDDNLFLNLSALNELRRNVLEQIEAYAISKCSRSFSKKDILANVQCPEHEFKNTHLPKISVLLNNINLDFDYSALTSEIYNIYVPLKYFTSKKYENILKVLSTNFDTYIYMPTITKGNYKNLFYTYAESSVKKYDIKGFVISNICNIKLLNELFTDLNKYFKIIANYTFNVFNVNTILELKKLGISHFTMSPELDKNALQDLCNYNYLEKELIVYGRTPLINMNYCLLRRNRQMLSRLHGTLSK